MQFGAKDGRRNPVAAPERGHGVLGRDHPRKRPVRDRGGSRRQPLVHRGRRWSDWADHSGGHGHGVLDRDHPESGPFGITAGPDGNLWFTEDFGNRIGRIGVEVAQHGHHIDRPLGGATTSTSSYQFFSVSKGTTDGTGQFSHLGKITFHKHYTAFRFTSSNTFTDAGTETVVAANGDKLFATFTATGRFTGAEVGSTVKTTDFGTITGGTGRFAGASGAYKTTTSSVITSVVFGVEATSSDTSPNAGEIAY